MPRFVILEHDHPTRHWDFMLEAGDCLLTWRLATPPQPEQATIAERIANHRPRYLDYEGPVSGGRGTVTRWDAGVFEWLEDADDRKEVRLNGGRLDGVFRLVRQSGEEWIGSLS